MNIVVYAGLVYLVAALISLLVIGIIVGVSSFMTREEKRGKE